MNVTTIGVDLAKNVFHVHGADATGRCVFSQQLSRAKLAAFMANQPPCLIGMEACGRNIAEYEGEMDVDEQLVAALLRVAREVAKRVKDLMAP